MDQAPSAEAIKHFLQKDRKVLEERPWMDDGQFECKSSENLAILVQVDGTQVSETHLVLLGKILAAINLNIEDVALIDIDKYRGINLRMLRNKSFEHLIIFGLKPSQIGLHLNAKPYQAIHWQGVNILFAHSLSAIEQSTDFKKALWGALKQLFLS